MKRLLLALVLCNSVAAETNKTIIISNCSKFLNDPVKCVKLFEKAAHKAKINGFELYASVNESGNDFYYFVNHVGFMSITVAPQNNTCYIDFYCADDSFDYTKFISYFLKTVYHTEKPHIPTVVIETDKNSGAYEVIQQEDFFDKLLDGDIDILENF